MSDRVCPGPENREWRAAWVQFQEAFNAWDAQDPDERGERPQQPEIEPVMGDPVWCHRCTARIRQLLGENYTLVAMLASTADGYKPAVDDGPRVSGSPAPASPSKQNDDIDEYDSVLVRWQSAYLGKDDPVRKGRLATRLYEVTSWLLFNLDPLLAHEDIAEDFGKEILRWHRELSEKSAAGQRTHVKPRPCPSCGYRALYWTEGEDLIHCRNCACTMSLEAYEHGMRPEDLAEADATV